MMNLWVCGFQNLCRSKHYDEKKNKDNIINLLNDTPKALDKALHIRMRQRY